jgi:hypothetical protein
MEFPDVVEIISATNDPLTGAETKGLAIKAKCYFEDSSRVLTNDVGQPVQCVTFAMIPPGTKIKRGYFIRRFSKSGLALEGEILERIVRVSPIGGFSPSHIEIFTGNAGGFA